MTAAIVQANEIGFRTTTVIVTVPENDVARLMYYLNCVCKTLDCADDANIQRYISYQNWYLLSLDERKALVTLCRTFKPEVLNDLVFFQNDALCKNGPNEFYEITHVRHQIIAAESIIIAGRTRQVNKIMVYKKVWLQYYYTDPIRRLTASFSASTYSAVTYQRPNNRPIPTAIHQPAVVRSSSDKSKYICCGIVCFILCVVPTIISIIVGIVASKK